MNGNVTLETRHDRHLIVCERVSCRECSVEAASRSETARNRPTSITDSAHDDQLPFRRGSLRLLKQSNSSPDDMTSPQLSMTSHRSASSPHSLVRRGHQFKLHESSNGGQVAATSQQNELPLCRGTNVRASGRLLSVIPFRSFTVSFSALLRIHTF